VWVEVDVSAHEKFAAAKSGMLCTIVPVEVHAIVVTIVPKGWHTMVAPLIEFDIVLPLPCYSLFQGREAGKRPAALSPPRCSLVPMPAWVCYKIASAGVQNTAFCVLAKGRRNKPYMRVKDCTT
jgi:hypothetical protein